GKESLGSDLPRSTLAVKDVEVSRLDAYSEYNMVEVVKIANTSVEAEGWLRDRLSNFESGCWSFKFLRPISCAYSHHVRSEGRSFRSGSEGFVKATLGYKIKNKCEAQNELVFLMIMVMLVLGSLVVYVVLDVEFVVLPFYNSYYSSLFILVRYAFTLDLTFKLNRRSLCRFAGQQTYTVSDLGCCGLEYHSWANVGNLLHSYMPSFSVMSLGKSVTSSASSAVTYTSVYTDSEPGRVFWGADEELSNGGSLRVIVYGYDGLPMQPTPPAPQDEDEHKLMFIQPHDPDYVPEPMYPEYIPLEDEHVLPTEEQPLPPVDSPTAKLPGYVAESDPKEDLEEYEDDEIEDGPVDYPMNGGDDRDDDDGDSSRDDTDDEDEDEEEALEEHLAPADFAVVIPNVKLVSPPEGIEPVIPPPFTDTTITEARITVRLQAAISLPPEAEVERILAMPTPPPSPLTSISPPSTGERLARMASTQALIDVVTAALPSPPLPPLPPPLYIPSPVDRKDDIPETEMPPRKRSCLFTLGSRYEIGESSTARPTGGRGIDYGFVSTLDAEARQRGIGEVGYGIRDTWVDPAEAVPEIAPMTLGEDSRTRISQRVTMDSQRVNLLIEDRIGHKETILIVEEEAYAAQEAWAHSIGLSSAGTLIQTQHQLLKTHFQMQQVEIAELRETDHRRQAQLVKTLRVMGDMRREMGDMQAELLALREQPIRARQPGEDARVPDHQDAPRDADSHI
nr:hypothetical protein [Tanacetum cinerariifolium]